MSRDIYRTSRGNSPEGGGDQSRAIKKHETETPTTTPNEGWIVQKNVWTSDKSWEPDHSLTLSHSLIHSLSTCWTTFVFMSMLKSHSLTLSQSHILPLFHSLIHYRHAEQILFSCLCLKITLSLSHYRTFTLFQCLIQSLLTCWASFVFMSMLISRCLLPKIAMVFFWPPPPQQHHPHLWVLSS